MEGILSKMQKEAIRNHLSTPPVALKEGLDPEDFPREIDTYIYDASEFQNPVYDWDNNYIRKGRFFDLVAFSNKLLFALYLGHDRYGMLGEIKILETVNPNDVQLKRATYDKLLDEIRAIVLEIEPGIPFSCNKFALMNQGPVVI